MPYVKDNEGRLNNFAREPKMYMADPISADQKRSYIILTLVGTVLVGALIAVAAIAS
jgi:hypothetical protein